MATGEIVLDLETQLAFDEVEGRRPELLKVSLVGVYRYDDDRYFTFEESQLRELAPVLEKASRIIGFNHRRFDFPVLKPYFGAAVEQLPLLDIMDDIQKQVGHRVSLESVARATLGEGKSGSGLDAIKYFREGRMDELKKYCLDDVRITRDVYNYGRRHHQIFFTTRDGASRLSVPVNWGGRAEGVAGILELAYQRRCQVEIEFAPTMGEENTTTGVADIYHIEDSYLEAYLHTSADVQQLQLVQVIRAKALWGRYDIPSDYAPGPYLR